MCLPELVRGVAVLGCFWAFCCLALEVAEEQDQTNFPCPENAVFAFKCRDWV